MSNRKRPTSELDPVYRRRLFQQLRADTTFFKGWVKDEINALADMSVILKVQPNDRLVRRGEKVDWLGILLAGEALVSVELLKLGYLAVGDMIGYMGTLKLDGNETHKFDVSARSEGYLAVVFADDIANMPRKAPRMAPKFYEVLATKALNVVQFQHSCNAFDIPSRLSTEDFTLKRLADILSKVPEFNALIGALDRMEQKVFLSACRFVKTYPDMLIFTPNTLDSCVILLTSGEVVEYRPNESYLYRAGDFIGLANFISPGVASAWKYEVSALGHGGFVVFSREHFNDIAIASSAYAVKIYSILAKLLCEQIGKSKTETLKLPLGLKQSLGPDTLPKAKGSFIELDTAKSRERSFSTVQSQRSMHASVAARSMSSMPSIKEESELEGKHNPFSSYSTSEEFPPLYVFNSFKAYLLEPMATVDRSVSYMQQLFSSQLIADKLEKQRLESEEAKKGKKTRKPIGRASPRTGSPRRGRNSRESKTESTRGDGVVIDLKDEYIVMEAENKSMALTVQKLLKEKEELLKQAEVLKQQIGTEKLDRERLQVM